MARLGDLTNVKTGKLDANAASPDGQYPFFTCSKETLRIATYQYDCECVLVAGNGDLNVKYYCGKFDAYQRTYIIESKDNSVLLVPYMYYFLDGYVETLRDQSIGGVIKYIKLGNLTEAQIPLPDLCVQSRIVDRMKRLEQLISLRKQQLAKLDELVKARFVEMFGDPVSNLMKWETPPLSACLNSIENGKSFVCESEPRKDNWPAILKLSAVTYGDYRAKENKSVLDVEDFIRAAEIHAGDLLFTRKNTPELVGMSAYVFETEPYLMMPDLIFRLNTNEKCDKIFLWQLINHDLFRTSISNLASGSAKSMSNISKERLSNLQIICPPVELQSSFSEFVKQIHKQKLTIQQGLAKLEVLKKTLMQEYFG